MDRRFTALRVIATILKILAWLVLIVGFLGAVISLVGGFLFQGGSGIVGLDVGGPLAGIAMFVVALIIAILNFLVLYAGAEFIYVFLSMEENTRRTAYFLQQEYVARQGPYSPPPPPDYDE
jgi:hypothetical protein